MNTFQQLIKEICKEEEIKFQLLSKDWVIMLEKQGKTRFISGYKFDLNPHGFGYILDDKYATYEVLSTKNIPIVTHHILFSPQNVEDYATSSNQIEKVYELFEKYNQNIVVKPNEGTCGKNVYHITKKEDIEPCLKKIFSSSFSISICPYYKIKMEYRMIILQNKCLLMYGKKRPQVVGDGKKTLRELLIDFNPLLKDKFEEEKYSQILEKGKLYTYSWKNNLSEGSIPTEVPEAIQTKLKNLLNQITKEISLGFCSVDVIETEDQGLHILELNSGIMMNHYIKLMENGEKIAKEIYRNAIKEMFLN